MRLRTSLQDSRRPGRPDKLIPMQYWQKRQPNATETSVPNQNTTKNKHLSNKQSNKQQVQLCRLKSRSREDYSPTSSLLLLGSLQSVALKREVYGTPLCLDQLQFSVSSYE